MPSKERPQAAAVIDIGSSVLSMEIAQAGQDGPQELDYLEYPVNLGYETFTHGRVSFRTMEEVARVLEGFTTSAKQYGVEDDAIRIMATTALREASNSTYVLDQLRNKTGLFIDVLEDGQEMALIFKEVLRRMEDKRQDLTKPFMMAYIGTGSVGIAAVRDGAVFFARNIRVGSLKLSQMLGETGERTPRFHVILEEYLSALTRLLRDQMQAYRPGRFVVCGKEIELIAELTHTDEKDGMLTIERRALSALYDDIKALTPAQVSQKFSLREEQGEVLLPSLAIYMTLSEFTNADAVFSPGVVLVDSILYELLYPKEAKDWNRRFEDGVAASSWELARRYQADINHAATVEKYSMQIFDSLKKMHGFSSRERRLLQAAAILHDIGKFVNSKYHDVYSCHILMDSNIIGMSTSEMAMVANIARYHSGSVPSMSHAEWADLMPDERLTVSKLAAILRLADSLDRSHMQKLTDIEIKQKENELIIAARTDRETALEEWTFAYKSEFFTEVFGLRCIFKKKGRE
jgi:exopolyphosphatase / guanosine-5'-triphosphate,3'-diphosphate pyrophosphatase